MTDYQSTFDARGHDYNAACDRFPRARESERSAVLERADLKAGLMILDLPAGGGYLADGIRDRLGSPTGIDCVEPSRRFGARLGEHYKTYHDPIDNVGLPDQSFDRILSLAGLHHIPDRTSVYREWKRLLSQAGRIVVADVATDTPTGHFLNEFVDANTPGGHKGIFISPTEFRDQFSALNLRVTENRLIDVPWHFRDREAMGEFCWRLFSCQHTSPQQVTEALDDYVGVRPATDGIALRWQLRLAVALNDCGSDSENRAPFRR